MQIAIRRNFSNKFGTHYGLYIGSSLVHFEFSRKAAKKVRNEISSDEALYGKIYEQINQEDTEKVISKPEAYNNAKEKLNKSSSRKPEKNIICKVQTSRHEYSLSKEEDNELERLLKHMRPLGFSSSSELSNYIKQNNLGGQYPNIAGVIKMKDKKDTWNFKGGISPKLYRIICEQLDLHGKNTLAQVVGFKPYKLKKS